MKIRSLIIFTITVAINFMATVVFAQELSLIPLPQRIDMGEGRFTFSEKIEAYVTPEAEDLFKDFARDFEESTGIKIKKISNSSKAKLQLHTFSTLAPEGYTLKITQNKILIAASQPAGFFYALQTLKQLMPRNVMAAVSDPCVKEWSLPVLDILDEPRFEWRGFMLDEGRHIFGKEAVKQVIDIMAMYKMNRFHWHLSEDQGWRVEIKKYPLLTQVGAWRERKGLGYGDVKPDTEHYGGYYTQKDIKEIVAYAKSRFVEIVPEIDIPGHSQAAIAAYPEILACDPENRHDVWLWQGISTDVINVANPQAVKFAKDVIDELTALFPFGYIHLGGDECPVVKWEQNAQCRERLKAIGSTNYRDLQIDFYSQLLDHIKQKPKSERRKLIFWNEILHGNTALLPDNDITVMAWVGADKAAAEAAKRGMTTILSPQIPYYINRKQSPLPTEPMSQGRGTETVEAVYNYVPMKGVDRSLQSKYLGVQANFWSEWVADESTLQYLILPRLAAVAEAGWTEQTKRNYEDFVRRLQPEGELYRKKGYNYGKHIME
ncbi:MAG: beta-N-acetylhexosaminidase [Alistipes sp.]|nr:beta-N-acetylhexosaminidase [Alistipes sp.]